MKLNFLAFSESYTYHSSLLITTQMHLFIQNIHSSSSGDFLTQLHSCLIQIQHQPVDKKEKRRLIKITVFSSCKDNADYLKKIRSLNETLSQLKAYNVPVSLIIQPPIDCGVILEVWSMDYSTPEPIFTYTHDIQSSVLYIDYPDFSILLSSQFSARHATFKENTAETFNLLDASLRLNGFDYNEIVRQWNYIENITLLDTVSDIHLQNYQIFNDLRSLHYEKSDFINGYPSATGIGMEHGGCTIEAIAFKEKVKTNVKPVTNSIQVDAHNYSSTVLVGNAIEEVKKISTPKFERGKYLQFGEKGFLFISGTASIIGETTVFPEDVAQQTLTTLRNIDHLISMNNLNHNNIIVASHPQLLNYRVYLKNESDYSIVKSLCDDHNGKDRGFIVKADICRSNLMVEIEANYLV